MYIKSLKRPVRPGTRPFILNAVARCYYKTGRFPQALYYYETLIRDHESRIRENLPLWLTVLRQKALARKNLGHIPESLQTYLVLYEQIIKHESLSGSDQFEMYKNEALDHLSRHREVLTDREFQVEGGPDLAGLRNMTDLDRLLDWRFTEPDTDGPAPENGNEERFLKLREMNTPSDEKTWFYRAVRERVRHRNPDPGNNSETFLLFPANRLVDTCYRSFGPQFPEGPAVFGFMVSADHIREQLFPAEEKLTALGRNTDLRIAYDADETPEPAAREDLTTLFKLPFKRVLNGYSLILSSGDPDFFSGLAAKEVWLNYSLIIALILLLLLGTLFFYRYTSKEMEMLRSRSEFIDRVSHTLKTPLTRMRLLSENITSGWVKDEQKRMDFLKTIISETEAMNETIHQMLSFSQIDSGKKHYRFSRISMNHILNEYLSGHPYRGIIRTEQDDNLPLIDGDPDGIRLIISNLVQNSIKYSPREKDILIRLKQKEDSILLEIHDHGIGIPEADRKRVFEKFFRSESREVMTTEGNGLGLFLVQHAVTAHGGKISVESTPGKGTSFFITLPLRAAGSST